MCLPRADGWLGEDAAAPGGQGGGDHRMETPRTPRLRGAGREDLRGPRLFKWGRLKKQAKPLENRREGGAESELGLPASDPQDGEAVVLG